MLPSYIDRIVSIKQDRVRVLKHDGIDYVKRNAAQGSNRVSPNADEDSGHSIQSTFIIVQRLPLAIINGGSII